MTTPLSPAAAATPLPLDDMRASPSIMDRSSSSDDEGADEANENFPQQDKDDDKNSEDYTERVDNAVGIVSPNDEAKTARDDQAAASIHAPHSSLKAEPPAAEPAAAALEHSFEAGDHVIRWEMLPIVYPIQIHGIVLECTDDYVTIADFGLTTYVDDGGGEAGSGDDKAQANSVTPATAIARSEEEEAAAAAAVTANSLDAASVEETASTDASTSIQQSANANNRDVDAGTPGATQSPLDDQMERHSDDAQSQVPLPRTTDMQQQRLHSSHSKSRLNVITIRNQKDVSTWKKVNYGANMFSNSIQKSKSWWKLGSAQASTLSPSSAKESSSMADHSMTAAVDKQSGAANDKVNQAVAAASADTGHGSTSNANKDATLSQTASMPSIEQEKTQTTRRSSWWRQQSRRQSAATQGPRSEDYNSEESSHAKTTERVTNGTEEEEEDCSSTGRADVDKETHSSSTTLDTMNRRDLATTMAVSTSYSKNDNGDSSITTTSTTRVETTSIAQSTVGSDSSTGADASIPLQTCSPPPALEPSSAMPERELSRSWWQPPRRKASFSSSLTPPQDKQGTDSGGGGDNVAEGYSRKPNWWKSWTAPRNTQDYQRVMAQEQLETEESAWTDAGRPQLTQRYMNPAMSSLMSKSPSSSASVSKSTLEQQHQQSPSTLSQRPPQKLPKADPPKVVLARTRFLLEHGESVLPPYHVFASNSECIAVWCMTGRWSTLQASVFLHSTAIGHAKTATAITLGVAATQPWLVPALAVVGGAAVGMPWIMLKRSKDRWEEATIKLNDLFWSQAEPEVFVECIEKWSGIGKEECSLESEEKPNTN